MINNEITVDFTTGDVKENKYLALVNKAYDSMDKADFKDFVERVITIMSGRLESLEEDCDMLEEAKNEALDLVEEVSGMYNDLLDKYFNLLDKTDK